MTVSTLLVDQQRAVQRLLTLLDSDRGARLSRVPDLVDAAMAMIAIEDALLRERRVAAVVDDDAHRAAHLRARLALFRLATAPSDGESFERSLAELTEVFGARALTLLETCDRVLDESARFRVSLELSRILAGFRSPSCADYLVAYAAARAERVIDRVA